MESRTEQSQPSRLSGLTGRGWGLYKQNRPSQLKNEVLRPDHMAGSYNVQIETLGLDTECSFVQPSKPERPAIIAGRFAVLPTQYHENPAKAGFFRVQEPNMLRKVEPITKINRTPNTLQRKHMEIQHRMQEEKQRSREAMANLFLAGPTAWPDSSFDVEFEDEDYEEWVPLDS